MPYKIVFRERADKELLESVAWYKEKSIFVSENFKFQVDLLISRIEKQPDFFRISYRNYREAKTSRFPYSVVYFVNEKEQEIVITSIFHQKRNPKKKFK